MSNFDTYVTGVLNKSIHQFSGKYKLVVQFDEKTYSLHLSDYDGFSMPLDMGQDFMPQVGTLLKYSSNNIPDNTLYGVYRKGSVISSHIPLVLTEQSKYPDHFVSLLVPNKDINIDNYKESIYIESKTIDVIDLKKLGLHEIFDDLIHLSVDGIQCDRPVDMIWSDNNDTSTLVIKGWSIVDNCMVAKHITLDDDIRKGINIDGECCVNWLSNHILSLYEKHGIIYPRHINLEFQIHNQLRNAELRSDIQSMLTSDIQNMHCYLSYTDTITVDNIKSDIIGKKGYHSAKIINMLDTQSSLSVVKFSDAIIVKEDSDVKVSSATQDSSYKMVTNSVNLQETANKPYRLDLIIKNIDINAQWILRTEFGTNIQEHVFSYDPPTDGSYHTLREKISQMYGKINKNYLIDCITGSTIKDKYGHTLGVKLSFTSTHNLTCILKGTSYTYLNQDMSGEVLHSYNIIDQDVAAVYHIHSKPDEIISKKGEVYKVLDMFNYDGVQILRLDKNPNIKFETIFDIESKWNYYYYKLDPIPFLSTKYVHEKILIHNYLFVLNIFKKYYKKINSDNNTDINNALSAKRHKEPILFKGPDYLEQHNSFVNGTNITTKPRPMNFDIHKYGMYDLCDTDYYYFLIRLDKSWIDLKSLSTKIGSTISDDNDKKFELYRYIINIKDRFALKDSHKRTLIYKISSNSAETVFMGVKYTFDIKYAGYRFSTVLNVTTKNSKSVAIDHVNKTIDLNINVNLSLKIINELEDYIDPGMFENLNGLYTISSMNENDFRMVNFNVKDLYERVFFRSYDVDGKSYIGIKVFVSKADNGPDLNIRSMFNLSNKSTTFSFTDIDKKKIEAKFTMIRTDGDVIIGQDFILCDNISIEVQDGSTTLKTYALASSTDITQGYWKIVYEFNGKNDLQSQVKIYDYTNAEIIITNDDKYINVLDNLEKYYKNIGISKGGRTVSERYTDNFIQYAIDRSEKVIIGDKVHYQFYVTRFDVDPEYFKAFEVLKNFKHTSFSNSIFSTNLLNIKKDIVLEDINNSYIQIENASEFINIKCYPMSINKEPGGNSIFRFSSGHCLYTKNTNIFHFQEIDKQGSDKVLVGAHCKDFYKWFDLDPGIEKMFGFWTEYVGVLSSVYNGREISVSVNPSKLKFDVYNEYAYIDIFSIIYNADLSRELDILNSRTLTGYVYNSDYWKKHISEDAIKSAYYDEVMKKLYVNFVHNQQTINNVLADDKVIPHHFDSFETIVISAANLDKNLVFNFRYR